MQPEKSKKNRSSIRSQTKKRIMVVDGSEVSRTIVTRILRSELKEAEIDVCTNGAEALAHLEKSHFDLVTTALLLPDMDGLDLSRLIRKSETHHYTPIIVVSSDADNRLLREGFASGITDYYDKSMGYQSFVEFIKAFLQRNSALVGRVLFVEDSPTAAKTVCNILERHGLQVTHTTHAEQALEWLEQSPSKRLGETSDFDIVITDFFLEGAMTGGDLLHAIRVRLRLSQQEMPVLVLTGDEDVRKQTDIFHAGANDFVQKPVIEEILMARTRSLLLIKQQFNALRMQSEEMRRQATIDSLTGVYSKRFLIEHGNEIIRDIKNQPLWVMLLDLDHFKKINDTLGHVAGDHVLAAMGELLLQQFTPKQAVVVRFGGEEFAVLMFQLDRDQALAQAEEIRHKVQQLCPVSINVTVSIGLTCCSHHANADLTQIINFADIALYTAKGNGRNQVQVYCAPNATS